MWTRKRPEGPRTQPALDSLAGSAGSGARVWPSGLYDLGGSDCQGGSV